MDGWENQTSSQIHGPYPIPMDVTLIHMGVGSAERHGVTFHPNSGLIPLSAIGNSINPFRKLVSLPSSKHTPLYQIIEFRAI